MGNTSSPSIPIMMNNTPNMAAALVYMTKLAHIWDENQHSAI